MTCFFLLWENIFSPLGGDLRGPAEGKNFSRGLYEKTNNMEGVPRKKIHFQNFLCPPPIINGRPVTSVTLGLIDCRVRTYEKLLDFLSESHL